MEQLIEHAGHVAMNSCFMGNWYDGSWCQQTP